MKAGKVTSSQVTLSIPRITRRILDQSRGAATGDVAMEEAPPLSPVGSYEIFEPITPAQPKRPTRKVDGPPVAGSSGKQKQPLSPHPGDFTKLIDELNRVYEEFKLDMVDSDLKNEETLKKAEEAPGQLQAQLGLINAQSQNLASTQQTVQALVDELKRTQQVVETQLEMVKAQTGGISKEVAGMIKSVTDASVTQYLSGIKIHTKNTDRSRKEMEDWIKEGKGEEWWDTEMEKWDTVDKDDFDTENPDGNG